jgi:hypothetical protein
VDLAHALESFNRKERNLLVRAVLGHKDAPLLLCDSFRAQLVEKLGIELPSEAWWATDYHFDWLAGGLCLYVEGIHQAKEPRQNRSAVQDNGDIRHLVEGNQEDIDLVIATGQHLIMIEAKAFGAWDNRQMASKLERLRLLHEYYLGFDKKDQPVHFHLLITSPRKPEKLDADWPTWACREGEVPWIPLDLNCADDLLEVTRCDQAGRSSATGEQWRCQSLEF